MPKLEAFEGEWCLTRRIEDRRGGSSGRLEGRAAFTPVAEGLVYRESGTLVLDAGPALTAHRDFLWSAAPPRIRVRFADGRAFHAFAADGRIAEGRHLCGADLYVVRYDFSRWPRWHARWTVSGPRKDYTIRSAYVGR